MRIYLDQEFHEYEKTLLHTLQEGVYTDNISPRLPQGEMLNLIIGMQSVPTIDLISIGLVSEDHQTYYALSSEFDVDMAWNNDWLRENVLVPIAGELLNNEEKAREDWAGRLTLSHLKELVAQHGKTRSQIASDVIQFVNAARERAKNDETMEEKVVFVGYYSDYDWVVFCWLFGRMIDLPEGFPMYCYDLKQEFDRKMDHLWWIISYRNGDSRLIYGNKNTPEHIDKMLESKEEMIKLLKNNADYPKPAKEHHALEDAIFNLKLDQYLQGI